MTFQEGEDDLTDKIDFIVCLGGDGTLLYASSLFQESVPPIMAFHLGSLGFLTPFEIDNFDQQITHVLEGTRGIEGSGPPERNKEKNTVLAPLFDHWEI